MFICCGFVFYNIFFICVAMFGNVVHMCFPIQVINISVYFIENLAY